MKSAIRKKTYKSIYRLLDKVCPVNGDCGRYCGAACCTCGNEEDIDSSDFNLGIYLLPGEDKMFDKRDDWMVWSRESAEDFDFPESWHGSVYFVRCKTPPLCPRQKRPLQCRFFPLAPHFDENGLLRLILSTEKTPYTCPLIADHANIKLNDDFVRATYTVWKHLVKDPLIFDFVELESLNRESTHEKIVFVK